MKPIRSAIHALALGLFCLNAYGLADPADGGVAGVLTDRTGALLPGGTIEIRGLDSRLTRSTVTDWRGRYVFDGLPPGRYAISAIAPGLERSTREDVVVAANAESAADLELNVARRQTFVEVTAPNATWPLEIETDPRTPRQPIPAHDGADYLKTIPGFAVVRKGDRKSVV
jgi:hypothetical protein